MTAQTNQWRMPKVPFTWYLRHFEDYEYFKNVNVILYFSSVNDSEGIVFQGLHQKVALVHVNM